MTDDELRNLVASIAIAQRELVEQQKQTDAQLAKTDAQLAKTDAQLAKTDAQLAQTDALVKKIGRKVDRVAELVGNIANNQGEMVEEYFYRSFLKKPVLGNMQFNSIQRNLNKAKGGLEDEYDLVLINTNKLVIFEAKAKAHPKDLERLVNKKMPNFPLLFAEFNHLHRYAGIATLIATPDVMTRAKELGLYVITQQGKHQVLLHEGREFSAG